MSDNLNAHIERIPFANFLGVKLIPVADDRIEAKLTVLLEHWIPMGGLPGGATMSLADTLGAMGAFRNLPEGDNGTTTIESKTNFLGPAKSGDTVIAVCTPVHVGRRTSVWQTQITTEAGKAAALVTQTQMLL